MAYHNIISLSDAEASFLTTLAASGKQIFVTKDGYDVLGKGKTTRDALARLVDKGWLERIEKGKYLIVPLEAGPDRTWTGDAHVIAGHLVSPSMVSHWSALNYWNLTEQVPRVTYVQTTVRKENRRPRVLARISHTSRLAVVGGRPDEPSRVAGPLWGEISGRHSRMRGGEAPGEGCARRWRIPAGRAGRPVPPPRGSGGSHGPGVAVSTRVIGRGRGRRRRRRDARSPWRL